MLKKLFVTALLLICGLAAFGQDKPRLGILPFTGGPSGDGDTITTLLTYQSDFMGAFTLVPITNAVRALVMEQNFQLADCTDSDTNARLGRMLNADFVVSGQIRRIGDRNLVIFALANVKTFELLAGVCREYRTLEEIPSLLTSIANIFIAASRRDTSALPRLAVASSNIAKEVTEGHEAETLSQILVIEIANTGKYAVLPRITTSLSVMLDYQLRGYAPVEGAKALGRAVNASYVLSTDVRNMGGVNMLVSSIFYVEDGSILTGAYRNYYAIADGSYLMAELARILTDTPARLVSAPPAARVQQPIPAETPAPVRQPVPAERPAPVEPVVPVRPPALAAQPVPEEQTIHVQQAAPIQQPENADGDASASSRLWTVGVSGGTALTVPWAIATFHATLAPFNHTFLEIGADLGLVSGAEGVDYYSLYPFAHFAYFAPFGDKGGWYMGAGGGYMMAFYSFPEGDIQKNIFAFDFTTGVNLLNFVDISYTLRTNFKGASNKLSVGFTYRF